MDNSFHGRTLATLAATGRAKYRKGFEPDMPGFVQVPFNDIDAVRKAWTPQVCAVMIEMVQGEGGILPADPEYLKELRAFCDEKKKIHILHRNQLKFLKIYYLYNKAECACT